MRARRGTDTRTGSGNGPYHSYSRPNVEDSVTVDATREAQPPFAGIYRVGFAHGQHLPSAKSHMNLGQLGLLYLAMASSRMSEVLDELGVARRQAIPRTS
jgi:hypothetical protein